MSATPRAGNDINLSMRLDVLIFGGGVAGLWCLDRFRRAGYSALLLESTALGAGQTIQAQGIIHGGGKYALRGVRDFAAVRAIKEMPDFWRRCLAGAAEPNLTETKLLSASCHLWLPRGSTVAKMQSWGFVPVLAKTGLLATPPIKVPTDSWPPALRDSVVAVYALAEPVISTGTLLRNFLRLHQSHIRGYDSAALQFTPPGVTVADATLTPKMIVLAAGTGNGELLRKAGIALDLMQHRPLGMVLLRGELLDLHGHCVVGGKTQLTITTPAPGVWQVGGEIAERLADVDDDAQARRIALREIRRWLPGIDFTNSEIAMYRAVRAEARTRDQRRPSGVHVGRVAPNIIAAWPTKLTMAPVLAEEVFQLTCAELKAPSIGDNIAPRQWPEPAVARYPWEECEWHRAD